MKYPCVLQIDITDCAAACLSSICKYYGKNISISTLRRYACTDKNGTNGVGLIRAAKKIGLEAKGYEVENKCITYLEDTTFPCIANVVMRGYNHYVVIYERSDNNLTIADPAEGIKIYTIENFNQVWTGIIFTFKPTEEYQKINNEKTRIKKIVCLISSENKKLLNIILMSLLYTALGISTALFFELLFDRLIPNGQIHALLTIAICFIFITILQMLLHFYRVKTIIKLERAYDKIITLDTVKHIIKLPLSFFATRQSGELISRINDSYKIRDALSGSSVSVVVDTLMAIICGGVLLKIDAPLFMVSIIILIFYFIGNRLYIKKIKRYHRQAMESNATVNADYVEIIKGMETIKSLGAEKDIDIKISKSFSEFLINSTQLESVHNKLALITNITNNVGYMIILSVGAFLIITNKMTSGTLLAFYSLLGFFISPIARLIDLQIKFQGAFIAFDRIEDIKDNSVEDVNVGKHISGEITDIKICDLSFAYGTRKPVLNKVNLSINRGDRLAIIGESGSGKTTLAKLLLGFYDFEEGDICFNGISIQDLSKSWLRSKVMYVSQEPYFFNGTIKENLLFGNSLSKFSDSEIMNIAKKMNIDEFIYNAPDGLNSHIQEGATNISGGQ